MWIAGQLMLPGGDGQVRLSPGRLRVEAGYIAAVLEGADAMAGACDLGGPGAVVMPGLIDAHLHLPQFGIIGAHGLGLLDWLERVTFPAERRWADPAAARAQTHAAADQLLSHGTTGLAAYTTVYREAAAAALGVLAERGLRAWCGQALSDTCVPEGLGGQADELIDDTAGLLAAWPAGGRVAAAVTPRFALSCSMPLMRGVSALAHDRGAMIQTHLAETRDECRRVGELFGGARYTEVYHQAGLLGRRSVLGHGVYIDDAGRDTLAGSGSVLVHCPLANSFLMSGRFDRQAALRAGVRLALGSDIGAGYERSMVRVARAMIETAAAWLIDEPHRRELPHALPTAAQAWHAVTAGNADALGWSDAGRLLVGCPADLLVVEPDRPLREPDSSDPLAALLFGWDDRWLSAVLLQGRAAWGGGGGSSSR